MGQRRVMIRRKDGTAFVPQSYFDDEKTLHKVFKDNPKLFPHEDFNLRPLMIVGREVSFESGDADHIAVDGDGNVVLIEFKRRENRPHRELLAQILDYAACLWRYSFEDFEKKVVLEYFRGSYYPEKLPQYDSLISAMKGFVDKHDPEGRFDERIFRKKVEDQLRKGDFTLILACTEIDDTLTGVMEYVNFAFDMKVYGMEIDLYKDEEREIFVPRAVAPKSPRKRAETIDIPTFLDNCNAQDRKKYEEIFARIRSIGVGGIIPRTVGVSYRIQFSGGEATGFSAYPTSSYDGLVDVPFSQLRRQKVPEDIIQECQAKLDRVGAFRYGKTKGYGRFRIGEVKKEDLDKFLEAIEWFSKVLK